MGNRDTFPQPAAGELSGDAARDLQRPFLTLGKEFCPKCGRAEKLEKENDR